jgi:hypothetical protein
MVTCDVVAYSDADSDWKLDMFPSIITTTNHNQFIHFNQFNNFEFALALELEFLQDWNC